MIQINAMNTRLEIAVERQEKAVEAIRKEADTNAGMAIKEALVHANTALLWLQKELVHQEARNEQNE